MKHLKHVLLLTLVLCLCLPLVAACGGGDAKTYSFRYGSATLTPGTPAKDALTALGEPLSFSESGSCGGIPGTEIGVEVAMQWNDGYTGFTVYTVPGTEGDTVNTIALTDDSVKTPEGLSIGSTRQDVTDALGIGEQSGDTLVYVGGSTRLTFSLRDGKVTGIHYGWIS